MLVLLDQGTPSPLASYLTKHAVRNARELGWETLKNGDLLDAAEKAGFQVFVTTDKNLRYQQNLAQRPIAIVVLGHARWPVIQRYVERVVAAVDSAAPGTYTEVEIPLR